MQILLLRDKKILLIAGTKSAFLSRAKEIIKKNILPKIPFCVKNLSIFLIFKVREGPPGIP